MKKLLWLLSITVAILFLTQSCSENSTSPTADEQDLIDLSQPLEKIPGDKDADLISATFDFSAPIEVTEDEISTIEVEGIEQRIIRTEIEIEVDPDATIGQINELFAKYDAQIVDMLEKKNFLILQIKDPGSVDLLHEEIDKIKEENIVEYAVKSITLERDKIETPVSQEKLPDHLETPAEYALIKHQIAIRAHAAWNLKLLMQELENSPWIIVADYFGNGEPRLGFNIESVEDDFAKDLADPHGYNVLSVIAGSHINDGNISEEANDILGVFPKKLRVRVMDIYNGNNSSWNKIQNNIYRLLKKVNSRNDGNIILNTSLGTPGIDYNDYAYSWIRKVRGEGIFNDDLENEFIHFTASGNYSGGTRYSPIKNSPWAHAGLNEAFKDNLIGSPDIEEKLTNIFVVENRVPMRRNSDTSRRYTSGCNYINSMTSGTISAVGTDVWSLTDPKGGYFVDTGTSMSSPQAAGVAALVWSVEPDLSVQELKEIINSTAEIISANSSREWECFNQGSQPVVDAYAAVLAAGGDNARKTLLDINEDDLFDEEDIEKYLTEFEEKSGELEYGRYDLNGSGQTGGDSMERFDLNNDVQFGTVSKTIKGNELEFNESLLTDQEILCFYSYSDLFEGVEQSRDQLLEGICYQSFSDPVVTTNDVENITSNSADVGGEVTDDGGKQVSNRGVCWDTSENPTTDDDCTSDGEGTGSFTSTITDLNPNIEYYVRAYAINSEGTAYGNQREFRTKQNLDEPTVTTSSISSISETSAQSGGNVTDDGNADVTTRGVCWDTSQNPTTSDDCTSDGDGTGSFTSELTDLDPDTRYFVRAFATNSEGTAFGNQREFRTDDKPIVSLNLNPENLSIEPGDSETTTASLQRTNFTGDVTLTVMTDLPSGVSSSIDQPGSGDSGTVTFSLGNSYANFEDFEVRIRASGDGIDSDEEEVYLNIERTGEIGLSLDPTNLSIEPGSSESTTATLSRDGFNGEVTLTVMTDLPTGVSSSIDQPGSGDTGTVTFSLGNSYANFENFEVRIRANGDGVDYKDEYVYLDIREQFDKPSVTTAALSSITETSAESGGNITDDGNAEVTERGVCWDTSQNPTTSDDCTSDGDGTGSFTSNLTNLNPNTEYYVRAYATNSEGTAYGNQLDFTTDQQAGLPSVTTASISSISETSAQSGGNVTDDGNADVTTRGVCWDTSQNPTTSDDCTSDGDGTGSFTSELTDLDPDTRYFVRAFSTNSEGTAYGNQRDFRTENVQTYSIFGVVAEDDGTSIEGLDMLLIRHDQNSNLSTSTDNSGYYIFENLRAGEDYSVAPQSTDEFDPTNQRFNNLQSNQTQDFVRVPETYTISGTVFDSGGQGIDGLDMLLIRHDQDSNLSTTTDGSGDYVFEELKAGDDYTVAPQSTDEFEPTNKRFDNLSSNQSQDFDKVEEENGDWPRDTETEVVEVTSKTGRVWMDRNLGASRAATSPTDEQAYGELYQWGRAPDGHQKENSATTTTLSNSDTPGHGDFILVSDLPYDWRSPQNDNLWQGVSGMNNPCPQGYRLPTDLELEAERQSWSSDDADGAFASPLKLTLTGRRTSSGVYRGKTGIYWSNTVYGVLARRLIFSSDHTNMSRDYRWAGFAVRCIKD